MEKGFWNSVTLSTSLALAGCQTPTIIDLSQNPTTPTPVLKIDHQKQETPSWTGINPEKLNAYNLDTCATIAMGEDFDGIRTFRENCKGTQAQVDRCMLTDKESIVDANQDVIDCQDAKRYEYYAPYALACITQVTPAKRCNKEIQENELCLRKQISKLGISCFQ